MGEVRKISIFESGTYEEEKAATDRFIEGLHNFVKEVQNNRLIQERNMAAWLRKGNFKREIVKAIENDDYSITEGIVTIDLSNSQFLPDT